jgi:hypothetical protein
MSGQTSFGDCVKAPPEPKRSARGMMRGNIRGAADGRLGWRLSGSEEVEIVIFVADSGLWGDVVAPGLAVDGEERLPFLFPSVARPGKGRERMRAAPTL